MAYYYDDGDYYEMMELRAEDPELFNEFMRQGYYDTPSSCRCEDRPCCGCGS